MTSAGRPELSVRRLAVGAAANAGAAVVASAAGLAVVLLAGRVMTPGEYASFASVWGLVFGWAAILGALEQEGARARSAYAGPIDRTQLELMGVACAGSALVMTMAVVLFFDVLHIPSVAVAALVVVSAAVFPTMFTARGYLAGSLSFIGLAAMTISEAVIRLGLVVAGVAADLPLMPVFVVAAAVGGCVGLPVLVHHASRARGPLALGVALRQTGTLMIGNGLSAALVTGAPVLVALAMSGAPAADVGRMQAAVVVSRFPLIGLMLLQSLLVPVFTRRRSLYVGGDHKKLSLLLVAAVPSVAVVSYVGAVPLLSLLYGSEFEVEPLQITLLTVGAMALGSIQVLVALAVSGSRHQLAPIAFTPTFVITVLMMFVAAVPIDYRVPLALASGPVAGLVIAIVVTSRWRRQGPRPRAARDSMAS